MINERPLRNKKNPTWGGSAHVGNHWFNERDDLLLYLLYYSVGLKCTRTILRVEKTI
jgi:hypothetical protein